MRNFYKWLDLQVENHLPNILRIITKKALAKLAIDKSVATTNSAKSAYDVAKSNRENFTKNNPGELNEFLQIQLNELKFFEAEAKLKKENAAEELKFFRGVYSKTLELEKKIKKKKNVFELKTLLIEKY